MSPFQDITDDEKWKIPVNPFLQNLKLRAQIRMQEEMELESQKKLNDSYICQILQKIGEETDMINIKQLNFEKELFEYEKRQLEVQIKKEISLEKL